MKEEGAPAKNYSVILVDPSYISDIFNPNEWSGTSRGIIESCASELGVLTHSAQHIQTLCASGTDLCRGYFAMLDQQWRAAPWPLAGGTYFGQVPELHLYVEGFFSSLKSLLDLLAQLLTSERIVGASLDGFHRAGTIYGGKVLSALKRNVIKERQLAASALTKVIQEHKALWLDAAIAARDAHVHPPLGASQVMFQLQLAVDAAGALEYSGVVSPHVGDEALDAYAATRLRHATEFAASYLQAVSPGEVRKQMLQPDLAQ